MGELLQPWHLIVLSVAAFMFVAPFWTIFKKAGFSPWLSLLMIFPLINLITIWVVAFSEWKPSSKAS